MDTEHLVPYVSRQRGGPPGQTAVDNLARVGRRKHRVKTHSRWTVTQPRNGTFLWRSPHGRWFLVDQHGTTNLGTL
jgi:hypothetical protein